MPMKETRPAQALARYIREQTHDGADIVAFLQGALDDPSTTLAEKAEARRLLATLPTRREDTP